MQGRRAGTDIEKGLVDIEGEGEGRMSRERGLKYIHCEVNVLVSHV